MAWPLQRNVFLLTHTDLNINSHTVGRNTENWDFSEIKCNLWRGLLVSWIATCKGRQTDQQKAGWHKPSKVIGWSFLQWVTGATAPFNCIHVWRWSSGRMLLLVVPLKAFFIGWPVSLGQGEWRKKDSLIQILQSLFAFTTPYITGDNTTTTRRGPI